MKTPKTGDWVKCVVAKSNFYSVGQDYEVQEVRGVVGLVGSDGLFDPWNKLVSSFLPKKDKLCLVPK